MPRPKAPCGTYSAYKRHLRDGSPVDPACEAARNARTEQVAAQRKAAKAGKPVLTLVATADSSEGTPYRRVDVLREGLEVVRDAIRAVAQTEPARLAPLLKEQREIARELGELEAAEGAKNDSLAEQLRRARAARQAGA
jgi:hypothetical protein